MKKFLFTKSGVVKQDLFRLNCHRFSVDESLLVDSFGSIFITANQVQETLRYEDHFERILKKGQKVFYSEKMGWMDEWGEGGYGGFDEHIQILHSGVTMEKDVEKKQPVQEKPVFAQKPRGKAYLVSHEETFAVYDESRSRIVQWQYGTEISAVLTTLLNGLGIDLYRDCANFQEGEGFPDKI